MSKKIVIIGGGYGGIVAAQNLQNKIGKEHAEVTLINKHDYHYITTHLHMPSAGTDSAESARVSIASLIDTFKTNFIQATVTKIDRENKKIVHSKGEVAYDYLVIGIGGEPETFGIPGLKEYALNIRSINTARYICQHIEFQFAKFKMDETQTQLLNFVVGGAGFTGIEFVAELANKVQELCVKYDVNPTLVNIYNVEAAPTILPGFDEELVEYAKTLLMSKGVVFKIGIAIKECTPEGVTLANDEFIATNTVVWAAGIRGNKLIDEAGFETMRGRIKVDDFLRAPGHDDVFVIGDSSLVISPEDRPYPPTAQIACQQGVHVAGSLATLVQGKKDLAPFKYVSLGTVASLGVGEAIGIANGKKYTGKKAALVKKAVDAKYLYQIGGLSLVRKKIRFFNRFI